MSQNTETTNVREETRPGVTYSPKVDIWETEQSLFLRANLPGVADDHLDVEVNDGVLSIDGRVDLTVYDDLTPAYTEYRVGNFSRRFTLPAEIDTEQIGAKLTNGVLELEFPKLEKARPRRIEIAH